MPRSKTAAPAEDAGRTYRVIGPHPVHGTPSGGTFTTPLDAGQETFLLEVGHIEIVAAPEPDSATDSADGADKE